MNKFFIMRTSLLWIAVMTASCLWVSGCTQEEKYPFLPEKDNDSDIVIPINISMAENGEYNAYSPDNTMSPRHNAPLIAEWAGVKTLSHTRTKESSEYSGPRIASMELTEDTLSTLTTRANTLSTGIYFRLIVFPKIRKQLRIPISRRLYLKWYFLACTETGETTHTVRNDTGNRLLLQYNCGIGKYPCIIYL